MLILPQSHCCNYPTRKGEMRSADGCVRVPYIIFKDVFFFSIFFHRQLEKQISRYVASGFVSGWSLCIFITYLSACCFIAPWRLTALRRFLCCIFKDFLKLPRRSRWERASTPDKPAWDNHYRGWEGEEAPSGGWGWRFSMAEAHLCTPAGRMLAMDVGSPLPCHSFPEGIFLLSASLIVVRIPHLLKD